MSNINLGGTAPNTNLSIGPIPTPATGIGMGMYSTINYPTINALRIREFNVEGFINTLRDENGVYNVFRNILPPKVTNQAITTGCVKLPDPDCLTTYTFAAAIDQERIIDNIIDPCDVALLGDVLDGYTINGVRAWALDEAKNVFNFIGSTITTTQPTQVNCNLLSACNTVRAGIEDAIVNLESKLYAELGDLFPGREMYRVLLSTAAASQLAKENVLPIFNWRDTGERDRAIVNVFGVEGVYEIPINLMPQGFDIIVYIPRFLFLKTMCKSIAPMIRKLS